MTRLKDLVHRSALRTRFAGETEVGSSAQVFEVEGLTIPAGTDWVFNAPLVLGTFQWPTPDQGVSVEAYMELSTSHDGNDECGLRLGTPFDVIDVSVFLTSVGFGAPVGPIWDGTVFTVMTAANIYSGDTTVVPVTPPGVGYVYISAAALSGGGTTREIHIVRARAVLQVI